MTLLDVAVFAAAIAAVHALSSIAQVYIVFRGIRSMEREGKRRAKEHRDRHDAGMKAAEDRHEAGMRAAEDRHEASMRAAEDRHEASMKAEEDRHTEAMRRIDQQGRALDALIRQMTNSRRRR